MGLVAVDETKPAQAALVMCEKGESVEKILEEGVESETAGGHDKSLPTHPHELKASLVWL
jgi:hypothetical protein